MTIQATVSLAGDAFFATLGDGRRITQCDLRRMALALHHVGVASGNVRLNGGPGCA